jgi:phosphate transport system protein
MAIRLEFQKELASLHQEIIRMGAAAEGAINNAMTALVELDAAKAREVIAGDDAIDEMERTIDQHCIAIIARQQPVAVDLRDVTSILKLITDLERIADHASDISERILDICNNEDRIAVPHDLVTSMDIARNMLRGALDAYVSRSEEQASEIIRMDAKVDEFYERIKNYLIHLMQVDSANVGQLVEMLLISKYVERIADHATNVAEWVIYYLRGRLIMHTT